MKLFLGIASLLRVLHAIRLDVESQIDRLRNNAKIYSPDCNDFLASLERYHGEYLSLQVLSDDQLVDLLSTIDFSRFPEADQSRCKLELLKRSTRSFVSTKARLEALLNEGRPLSEGVHAVFKAYLNPDERLAGITRITDFADRNPRSEQTVLEIAAWRRNVLTNRSDGAQIPLPDQPFLGPVAYEGRHLLPAASSGSLFSTTENIQKVAMALMEFYAGKVAEVRNQSIVYSGIPSAGTRYYGPRDNGQLFVWGTYIKPDTLTCFSHSMEAKKHEPFPYRLSCFDKIWTGAQMTTFENNFALEHSCDNKDIVASLLRWVCDSVCHDTAQYPSGGIKIVSLEYLPLQMRQASIATVWLFKKFLLLDSFTRRNRDLRELLKIPDGFKMNWDKELDIMFAELMTGKVIGLDAPEIPTPVVEDKQTSDYRSDDNTQIVFNHESDRSLPNSTKQSPSETEQPVLEKTDHAEPPKTRGSQNESTISNNPPQHVPPKRHLKGESASNSSDSPKSNFWVYVLVATVIVALIVVFVVIYLIAKV